MTDVLSSPATAIGWFLVIYPAALSLTLLIASAWHILRAGDRSAPEPSQWPSLALLVPACDEEATIGACIEALLACDYPGVEIHILSDGSTDGTVRVAQRFCGRGVRVHDFAMNRGKQAVLQDALAFVETDLVMVVDADSRPAREALRELVKPFSDPSIAGVTGNLQVAAHTFLQHLQAMEYASIIGLQKRANSVWGGLFTVSGAACCFRTEAVRRVGGFASNSVTEDIELSWRLQHAGEGLAYAPRALVEIQTPSSLRALWAQRARWSRGLVEVLWQHGAVWRAGRKCLAIFALEAVLSAVWLLLLTATSLATIFTAVRAGVWLPEFDPRWVAATLALFVAQSISAWLYEVHYAHSPVWRLLFALLYPLYFAIVVWPSSIIGWASSLQRGTARWRRTSRDELAAV